MAIRWLRQQRSPEAILSALIQDRGLSLELQPVPPPKAVFTVNLPVKLIVAVRARCRQQQQPISRIVAKVLEQWLEQDSAHG